MWGILSLGSMSDGVQVFIRLSDIRAIQAECFREAIWLLDRTLVTSDAYETMSDLRTRLLNEAQKLAPSNESRK